MKKLTYVAFYCFCLFVSLTSCRKMDVSPRQVQNSSTSLIGWWQPHNYLVQAKLYFGADGFFYNDTINGKAPIAGFWRKTNDTITCSAQMNGATELQFVISHLDNSSLTLSRVGIGEQQSFSKLDTPAITSPPLNTVAGTGILGYSGDGGLAVNAIISAGAIATDKHGNIYLTDISHGVIREVSIADGTIKTIVGNGRNGRGAYYSMPVMAICDYAFSPFNLAVDSADNVYFSDLYASAVYKLSRADNMVYAVAGNGVAGFSGDGGSATSASLNGPNGLALDKNGNLFIVDMNNVRIRKVSLNTGIITTVAGRGQGTPTGDDGLAVNAVIDPFGISLDKDGNIYFVNGNNSIEKISATTNMMTRIAGAPYSSLNNYRKGDGGPAINAMFRFPYAINVTSSGDIFVSDNLDNTVRKIDHATNLITTVAGTGYAGLNSVSGIHATGYSIYNPTFLATDPSGKTLYITPGNNRVFSVGAF